jgi:predicted transcriptional regulator
MRIAPRLKSGDKRIPGYSGLPPSLREELDKMAAKENCSRSWVIEQIILEWAGIRVKYNEFAKPKVDKKK